MCVRMAASGWAMVGLPRGSLAVVAVEAGLGRDVLVGIRCAFVCDAFVYVQLAWSLGGWCDWPWRRPCHWWLFGLCMLFSCR